MRSRDSIQPYAPEVGFARGPRWTLREELKKQERRGDIAVDWDSARESPQGSGYLAIPYLRLRSLAEVRRRARNRTGAAVGAAIGSAAGFLWVVAGVLEALWDARTMLLGIAGLFLLAGGVMLIGRLARHEPGCAGLHCPGCRSLAS